MTDAGRVADHNVEAEDTKDATGESASLLDVVERWKRQFSTGGAATFPPGSGRSPTPASSAPGPVRITQEMAWRAISRVSIVECVCGGKYRIMHMSATTDQSRHNRSEQHLAWRARMGIPPRGEPYGP